MFKPLAHLSRRDLRPAVHSPPLIRRLSLSFSVDHSHCGEQTLCCVCLVTSGGDAKSGSRSGHNGKSPRLHVHKYTYNAKFAATQVLEVDHATNCQKWKGSST